MTGDLPTRSTRTARGDSPCPITGSHSPATSGTWRPNSAGLRPPRQTSPSAGKPGQRLDRPRRSPDCDKRLLSDQPWTEGTRRKTAVPQVVPARRSAANGGQDVFPLCGGPITSSPFRGFTDNADGTAQGNRRPDRPLATANFFGVRARRYSGLDESDKGRLVISLAGSRPQSMQLPGSCSSGYNGIYETEKDRRTFASQIGRPRRRASLTRSPRLAYGGWGETNTSNQYVDLRRPVATSSPCGTH